MAIRLEDAQVFTTALEAGSFSAAARALGKTPSAVSKTVQRLENQLGARLFYRSSRSLRPTEDGRAFHFHIQKASEALADAEAAVSIQKELPSGLLRIKTMLPFAKYQMVPLMDEFLARYPKLQVQFHLGSMPGPSLDRHIDLAIWSGALPDSSMVAKYLASSRWMLCASPAYLRRMGTPRTPEDLARHNCLRFAMDTPWNTWHFHDYRHHVNDKSGTLSGDQGDLLLEMARAGLGIARLAQFHIQDDLRRGTLKQVLAEHDSGPPEPLYMVYPSRRNLNIRIAAAISFLEEKFGGIPPWES